MTTSTGPDSGEAQATGSSPPKPSTADTPAPKPAPAASLAATEARTPAPAPQIPDPAASADAPLTAGGVTVTETGTVIYPQPMKPAREGFVNLATVPPMGSLVVPPLEAGDETTVIDVYGTEVDQATAERAYAAAQAAGLSLREL